jgi:hypothetical protein
MPIHGQRKLHHSARAPMRRIAVFTGTSVTFRLHHDRLFSDAAARLQLVKNHHVSGVSGLFS